MTQLERRYTFHMLDLYRRNAFHLSDYQLQRDRYVIFSDAHAGDRRETLDEFQSNEKTFCHAMQHYLENDYNLVLNGDVEEGWKNRYGDIISAYEGSVYALEGAFAREKRHYRIWGNHDDAWKDQSFVDKYLGGVLKAPVKVHPAVILGNKIMIAHGHQGDVNADYMARFSRMVVRYLWRPVQQFFQLERNGSTAHNIAWRKREKYLYEWAKSRNLLLIAGHTHRAMFHDFSPLPYLNKVRANLLHQIQADPLAQAFFSAALDYLDRLLEKAAEIKLPDIAEVSLPTMLTPYYLNGGCCLGNAGITGIEIDRGEIRLVKWLPSDNGTVDRMVSQSAQLAHMLATL